MRVAASFLIAVGYTLLNGEHVKIERDLARRLHNAPGSASTSSGSVCFSPPCALAVLWYGVPFFLRAHASGEMSGNAGGLRRA